VVAGGGASCSKRHNFNLWWGEAKMLVDLWFFLGLGFVGLKVEFLSSSSPKKKKGLGWEGLGKTPKMKN